MTTPPQNHELSFPLGFHSNFYKNRAPTLGEKRQKSVRFARDVLQFATFCDTSPLKLQIMLFAIGLERERQTSDRDHQIAQKMLEFLTKRSIHLPNESGDAPGFLKQLLQNSTPTLHGNAKKNVLPVAILRGFRHFCDTPSGKHKKQPKRTRQEGTQVPA